MNLCSLQNATSRSYIDEFIHSTGPEHLPCVRHCSGSRDVGVNKTKSLPLWSMHYMERDKRSCLIRTLFCRLVLQSLSGYFYLYLPHGWKVVVFYLP